MTTASSSDRPESQPQRDHDAGLGRWQRIGAEVLAIAYIAVIAQIAYASGAFYVLFPELGALSHDVFTRPRGTWAQAPVLLAITPVLTGIIGIVFTRALPYGYLSVMLTVGGGVAVIMLLRSPIAPALSAGLLPLVLGVKSWWYPPGILLGTALLAILSFGWNKLTAAPPPARAPLSEEKLRDAIDDVLELAPAGYYWMLALSLFLVAAIFCVKLTGLRFLLFPPLVVIAFEMFGHTAICPWAKRPLVLPAACFLTAAGGLFLFQMLGAGPLTAACSMTWGVVMLRAFDLHVPPALAVALLPLVMDSPTWAYPFSVGIGTLLVTLWFLLYRWIVQPGRSETIVEVEALKSD